MAIAFYILLVIVSVQVIYWGLFVFSLSKNQVKGRAIAQPVSVIVCARNEESNLRELIPLLLQQTQAEFEVIIVNDRSYDGTYDFLLDAVNRDSRLKAVHIQHKPDHINGKKYALTFGIKAARYDWVLLTDADCRPASMDWIKEMEGCFETSKDIVIGYSPYEKHSGFLNQFIRFETITTAVQYFSFALIGKPYMGVGRNLAYRKKLFLDNKGFNGYSELNGGDDDLFVNKHANETNVLPMLSKSSAVYSKPKTTWKEFFAQKTRHLSVGKHYKTQHKLALGIFMFSWMTTWPLFIANIFGMFWLWALVIMILRTGLQIATMNVFCSKTGEKISLTAIPLLDFIFGFYYLVAGILAVFSKRISWKI